MNSKGTSNNSIFVYTPDETTSSNYTSIGSTDKSPAPSNSIRTVDVVDNHICICRCSDIDSVTDKDLQIEIKKIKQELAVDTTKLSSTVRRLRSADDKRTSSRAIGSVAVAIVVTVPFLIFLFDLPVIIAHVTKSKRNVLKR